MAGILAGAMMGGGRALQNAAAQGQRTASDYFLQQQSAEIQALRDARLAEIRRGEIQFAADVRRQEGIEAGEAAKKAAAAPVDDLSGTVRPQTVSEQAESRAGAYESKGMVEAAQRERGREVERGERAEDRLLRRQELEQRGELGRRELELRGDQLNISRDSLDEQIRSNKAVEALRKGQLAEAQESGGLERALGLIKLRNLYDIEDLQVEYKKPDTTEARRNQIKEELAIMRGVDGRYIPIKDESGVVTGIWDTARSTLIDPRAGAANKGGPSPGTVVDGWRFKGGNPNDRKNWEQPKPEPKGARIVPWSEVPSNVRPGQQPSASGRDTGQKVGPLSPMWLLEQEAAKGNQEAIELIRRSKQGTGEYSRGDEPIE